LLIKPGDTSFEVLNGIACGCYFIQRQVISNKDKGGQLMAYKDVLGIPLPPAPGMDI